MQCTYCGDYDTLTFLFIDDEVIYQCSNCKCELRAEDITNMNYDIEELEVFYEEENM